MAVPERGGVWRENETIEEQEAVGWEETKARKGNGGRSVKEGSKEKSRREKVVGLQGQVKFGSRGHKHAKMIKTKWFLPEALVMCELVNPDCGAFYSVSLSARAELMEMHPLNYLGS